MKKLIFSVATLFVFTLYAGAQQAPHFTQYTFNKINFNPALLGAYDALTFTGYYRHQWFGVEGAPRTAMLNVIAPLTRQNAVLGLAIGHDEIGMTQTGQATASYTYIARMKNGVRFLGALSGTVEYGRVNWNMADPADPDDQLLGTGRENVWKPNFGLGLAAHTERWYVGFSIPRVLKNSMFRGPVDEQGSSLDYMNMYMMAGVDLALGSLLRFRPGILLSYNPSAPFDVGVDGSFLIANALIVGGAYRLDDAVSALVQYRLTPQWKMGLAYDFTVSELNQYSAGTAEIMLEYSLDRARSGNRHIRFF